VESVCQSKSLYCTLFLPKPTYWALETVEPSKKMTAKNFRYFTLNISIKYLNKCSKSTENLEIIKKAKFQITKSKCQIIKKQKLKIEAYTAEDAKKSKKTI
jgi:hypothetical protein